MAEDERLGYWPDREGEQVRLTLEGPVSTLHRQRLAIGLQQGSFYVDRENPRLVRVERLPDVEGWRPGDVVSAADGVEFKRTSDGRWLAWGLMRSLDDDHPVRPLTLLVRDGKPVSKEET